MSLIASTLMPAFVLATLTDEHTRWVLLRTSGRDSTTVFSPDVIPFCTSARDKYDRLQKNIPYEALDELQVEIDIGIAELILGKAKGDNLLEADINYKVKRGEPEIRFRKSGKTGYLTIESGDRDDDYDDKDHDSKGDETWKLLFSPKVKIAFDMDIGLVDGELNMTDLRVIEISISGGLSDITLDFDEPNKEEIDDIRIEVGLGDFTGNNLGNANFRNLKLECGLGSAELNLEGDWRVPEAEMNVEVGLGSAKIYVPSKLGIEVAKDESFLSSVSLDRDLDEVRDGLYRNDNWHDAEHRISIDTDVGLGSVKVKVVD